MAQTTGIAIGENASASAVSSIAIGDNTTAASGHVAINTFDVMDAQGNIIPARLGAVTSGLSFLSASATTAEIVAAYNAMLTAMGKENPLPYDAEIEYIGLTGTQYINLGVVFQKNYVTLDANVWLDSHTYGATPALIGGGWPISGQGSLDRHRYWICSFPSLTAPYTINTAVGAYNNISTLKVSANQWHRFEIDYRSGSQSTKVDGTVYVSGSYAFDGYINPTKPLLYGNHSEWYNGPTINPIYGRLGSAKINVDGTSFDFIPVRVGSVGYLYDRVSGQLFGNGGAGSFVLGPDV